MEPKIFISYSWSSVAHRERVKQIADRLIGDGVDVIIDIYDLKEGHDKNAFMEKLVVDDTITNVLVMCDKAYTEKADKKIKGVGTESQIISQQVYTKVAQTKFIPIFCEQNDQGEPFLPVFMSSLIGIDFTTPEKENENWEQLIRLLHGQPLHKKPKLGPPPSFLNDIRYEPVSEPLTKFNGLKQALLHSKNGISHYREDFLSSAFAYLDSLRVRTAPENTDYDYLASKIVSDYSAMKPIKNLYCDWFFLELEFTEEEKLGEIFINFFETLLILPTLPAELTSYNLNWFDAQSIFVYDIFLNCIACMLKKNKFKLINEIFSSHYLMTESELSNTKKFVSFDSFFTGSEVIKHALDKDKNFYSPTIEFIKRNTDRSDIKFKDIIEADILCLAYTCCHDGIFWYAATTPYIGYNGIPDIFLRATQHKGFLKLKEALGVPNADVFKSRIQEKQLTHRKQNYGFGRGAGDYQLIMNLDNIDTLK